MAKPKSRYVCQACGSVGGRWQGQCPDCAEWNTLVQEAAEVSSIFAAKHNLQGGGRLISLVGLDSAVALPERVGFEELPPRSSSLPFFEDHAVLATPAVQVVIGAAAEREHVHEPGPEHQMAS